MSKDEIICVNCPHCGHTHQKSFSTNSVIICESCRQPYWALVEEGMCLTAKLEGKTKMLPEIKRMINYTEMLNRMIRKAQ